MNKMFFALLVVLAGYANALVAGIGMTSGTTSVKSHASDSYDYNFVGGYPASAGISGDGDTDLDLYVYDQYGNLACSSTEDEDTEVCSWTPKWTGSFRIVVKNRGSVYNKYFIILR